MVSESVNPPRPSLAIRAGGCPLSLRRPAGLGRVGVSGGRGGKGGAQATRPVCNGVAAESDAISASVPWRTYSYSPAAHVARAPPLCPRACGAVGKGGGRRAGPGRDRVRRPLRVHLAR